MEHLTLGILRNFQIVFVLFKIIFLKNEWKWKVSDMEIFQNGDRIRDLGNCKTCVIHNVLNFL
jgi:hypothetical protein